MALRPALHWTALAVLLCVLLAPAGEAQPRLDPASQLRADVPATRDASDIELTVVFSLPQDSEAYLKVSPVPGNAVFANGTAGRSGWWTDVELTGPDGTVLFHQATAGDPPSQFGTLAGNATYTLRLLAHAPAGALASERTLSLDYILAQHVASTREGSGGTLDESVGLHATVRVMGNAGSAATGGFPLWAWLTIAGAAVVAGVVVTVVLVRMRPRQDEPRR